MKKRMIWLILLLVLPVFVEANRVLVLGFIISRDNKASLEKMDVRYGFPDKPLGARSDYSLHIYDKSGKSLNDYPFFVSFSVIPDYLNQSSSEEIEMETSAVYFRLPYNETYRYIVINHNDRTIFRKRIDNLLCNNDGKCNNDENYLSCRQDCDEKSRDGFCERVNDGFCDADCKPGEDPDCAGFCGDDICNKNENYQICPADCDPATQDKYCNDEIDQVCDPDCEDRDPDCEDYKPDSVIKPPDTTRNILIIIASILVLGAIVILLLHISRQKSYTP